MTEVTTLIRVHSIECKRYLGRALLSLIGQKVDVSAIVICQGLEESHFRAIERFCESHILGSLREATAINVSNPQNADLRSQLLNEAIRKVRTRYLAFLDYDDLIYPNCYDSLIQTLSRNSSTIAFGQIVSVKFEEVSLTPYLIDKYIEFTGDSRYQLYISNFCPIHSYVIDLSKCDPKDVYFDESLDALEDYDFLLRFTAKYDSNFSLMTSAVGEYFRRENDTVRAAASDYPDASMRVNRIQLAREVIELRKRQISTTIKTSEFSWIYDSFASRSGEALPPATCSEISGEDTYKIRSGVDRIKNILLFKQSTVYEDLSIGRIENIVISTEKIQVSGWLNDEILDLDDPTLLLLSNDGSLCVEAVRFDREDVRSYFTSAFDRFGFNFEFRASEIMYQAEHLRAIVISADTKEVRHLPMIVD